MPTNITIRGKLALSASLLLMTITAAQCAFAVAVPIHGLRAADMVSLAAAAVLFAYLGLTANRRVAPIAAIDLGQNRPSRRDSFTSLASRGKFDDIVAERLRGGTKCALLLIDVDNFGRINDQHGYGVGDSLLQQLGDRLRRASPAADAVTHLFSDKFGVLACGLLDPGDVQTLALKLLRACNEPLFYNDISLRISVSISIAEAPRDGTSIGTLMQAATEALRNAQSGGGAVWQVYNPVMRHNSSSMRRELPDAIVNREIVPYYQPIVDLTSGRVVGLEVLARWNHPTRGLLLPDMFIPVAEEAGVLSDITLSLLRDVAHDARAWPEALFFAINIAPNQLHDVVNFAQTAPDLPSLPFHRMEVELTETALINDLETTCAAVRALRDRGTRVVLDDFGSGHGNFHHLRAVPFDRIKIDKEFALDILTDERAEICVRSIIQAARALHIDVTAEGVGTPEIAARVIQLGCQFGQGSLFSMPVPAKAVPAFLERLGAASPAVNAGTRYPCSGTSGVPPRTSLPYIVS